MLAICLDLEGVLIPEIWINVAERTGISALTRTTRDEPDYDRLMSYRLGILDQNDIKMDDITSTIESMDPMEGAMEFLVHDRDCFGLAVETVGTDAGQGSTFDPPLPAHAILHGNGRYGLQCLRNLDQLPVRGAVIVAAPLKIQGGSGSPLRVFAIRES